MGGDLSMQKYILPGFRFGFKHGYIVVNDRFNEVTGNKDIQEYYNGSLKWGHSEAFTENINNASFIPTEKQASNTCTLCNINVPGYPGVFCYVKPAHIDVVI
jgi:hypothetical protein